MHRLVLVAFYNLFAKTKTLLESVDSSAGINQFLFAGKVRMALGANFNTDGFLGRAGLPSSATSTFDDHGLVVRMDTLFHCVHLFHIRQSTYISRNKRISQTAENCKGFLKKSHEKSEFFYFPHWDFLTEKKISFLFTFRGRCAILKPKKRTGGYYGLSQKTELPLPS